MVRVAILLIPIKQNKTTAIKTVEQKTSIKKQIVGQITEDRVKRVILELYAFGETFNLSEMLGPLFKN